VTLLTFLVDSCRSLRNLFQFLHFCSSKIHLSEFFLPFVHRNTNIFFEFFRFRSSEYNFFEILLMIFSKRDSLSSSLVSFINTLYVFVCKVNSICINVEVFCRSHKRDLFQVLAFVHLTLNP